MKKCTLLLNEILGQEKWCKLFLDTLKNIEKRKKELKIREWLEAIHFKDVYKRQGKNYVRWNKKFYK